MRNTFRPMMCIFFRGPGTFVATVTTPRWGNRVAARTAHAVNGNGMIFAAEIKICPACRCPLPFARVSRLCTVSQLVLGV